MRCQLRLESSQGCTKACGSPWAKQEVESLLGSWAQQCPQRHQGSDGNVLVIHQPFLRERQRFHNGSCFVLGLRLDQEDNTFAIAARIPLADFPVEVEVHSCPNLCRHDGHDLLRGYALFGSLNDYHSGCLRYSNAGHTWGDHGLCCATVATGSFAVRKGIMD